MISIPFTKAHGAKNDFLLTWRTDAPAEGHSEIARAICDRYTGIGADGWMLVDGPLVDASPSIELYNSDGSKPELSGNGTRCAAAFLIESGKAQDTLTIQTGAGPKQLRLLRRAGQAYWFQMDMGVPRFEEEGDFTVVNVGNPQCVVPVAHFDFDWRKQGAALERDARFPNRTNVSFIRALAPDAIEARFWERGAGETNSSGTGSTGAFAAAVRRGMITSPGRVLTPAGPLELEWRETILLTGPAEIIGEGIFRYEKIE